MSTLAWVLVAYAAILTVYLAVMAITTARCAVCHRGVRRVHRIDVPLRQPDGRTVYSAVCHRCWELRRSL